MTDTRFPDRVRLHGGRKTHAARTVNGVPANLVTACGYMAGSKDERKDDDTVINCRNCIREMNR